MTARFHLRKLAVLGVGCSLLAFAQDRQIRLVYDSDVIEVQAVAPNIVRIHMQPDGKAAARTLVIDPSLQASGVDNIRIERNGAAQTLSSPEMRVVVDDTAQFSIQVQDAGGRTLATVKRDPLPGRGQ